MIAAATQTTVAAIRILTAVERLITAANWFSALTLEERREIWRQLPRPIAPAIVERGRRRLSDWRESPALRHPTAFQNYLASFELTEENLTEILGLEAENLTVELRQAPKWWSALTSTPLETVCLAFAKESAPLPFLPALQKSFAQSAAEKLRPLLSGFPSETIDWRAFPVLARTASTILDLHKRSVLECAFRLAQDYASLNESFGPELGELLKIEVGQGDAHCEGRSVSILHFVSGKKLVYKPRPLSADHHFHQLVSWLNSLGLRSSLRSFIVLDRGAYGWCEFISHEGCKDETEIQRFYSRQGYWLALFYFLSGKDLHWENLIACGEYPIPIDLEMIFIPRTAEQSSEKYDAAQKAFLESCHSVGLLPAPRIAQGKKVDGSGLGGDKSMRHRPQLAGKAVNAADYVDEISAGFAEMYELISEHRKEFEGKLKLFAEDETRFILRPTATYTGLLSDSFHPELLQDALEREKYFSQLWWETTPRPSLQKFVARERQELLQGDIPYFSAYTNNHDLFSGELCFANALLQTGQEVCKHRLDAISAKDLEFQQWIIKSSLALLADKKSTSGFNAASTPLGTAEQIGEWILRLAFEQNESLHWVTLDFTREATHRDLYLQLQSAGDDLYSGRLGIAWFLAFLGESSARTDFTKAAEKIWPALKNAKKLSSVGAYSGLGSALYASAHFAKLWRKDFRHEQQEYSKKIREKISADRSFDLISGSAGALLALLAVGDLENAALCGEHLLAHKKNDLWQTPMPRGLSHGTAGIALALARLGTILGERKYRDAALAAVLAEEALLQEKWTDINDTASAPQVSWCHGAAGIALARAKMLELIPEAAFLRDSAEKALQAAIHATWPSNHSLCHGRLGNLDTLLSTAEILGKKELLQMVELKKTEILEGATQELVTALAHGTAVPSLMTGLAGIGYGLLRLENRSLPSLLSLDAPEGVK